MMSELPIVATLVGGVPETVGETALLVPPHDPVALAESISTLLRSPDSSRCLGEHARKRALHLFTEEQFVDAYRLAYDRLSAPAEARVVSNLRKFTIVRPSVVGNDDERAVADLAARDEGDRVVRAAAHR
jgi:hypothetical protein